jgi:hypothetical protein
MDSRTRAILWAAIKQQNELRELALAVGQFEIAELAKVEVFRLSERLKNGVSNTRHDNQ